MEYKIIKFKNIFRDCACLKYEDTFSVLCFHYIVTLLLGSFQPLGIPQSSFNSRWSLAILFYERLFLFYFPSNACVFYGESQPSACFPLSILHCLVV